MKKIKVGGFEPHAKFVGESKGTWCDVAESNITKLDLAFNVHFLESRGSEALKKVPSLASQERNVLCAIFKKVLPLVIKDKLGSISIRFETELLSDEAQLDVRFISVDEA